MAIGKDIDIMVVGLSGKEFAEYMSRYLKEVKQETAKVGIIAAQPEKSKHLETATMQIYGNSVDFVGPRKEVYTTDSRVPQVTETTPEEDSKRRDFNFNSLFMDLDDNSIKDFTGHGIEDIKNRVVRTPLDPYITFMDDPLRILRAIRLATKFGFTLSPELIKAAQSPAIQDAFRKKISRERMHDEFYKMLTGPDPVGAMQLLKEVGLRDEVLKLPENFSTWELDQKSPHHDFNVWDHTLQALTNLQQIIKDRNLDDADKFIINLGMLLHDVGKLDPSIPQTKQLADKIITVYHGHEAASAKAAEQILRNLPGTKVEEIEAIKKIIIGAGKTSVGRTDTSKEYDKGRKALGKFVREMGTLWEHVIDVRHADAAGHKVNQFATHPTKYYDTMKEQIRNFNPNAIMQMKPLLNGQELMTMFNRKGGPWMAKLIAALIDWQLGNPNATPETARAEVQRLYTDLGLDKQASRALSKRAIDTMDFMLTDFADEFPKHCNMCQKDYVGLEDFLTLALPNSDEVRPELIANDPGLQCMSDMSDEDSDADLLYRNCSCGSTLIVKVPCMHQVKTAKALSKRAKDANDIIDGWFEEDRKNPTIKEERHTETKDVELWHGVTDTQALQKLSNGRYLLTPNPKSDMQKLWFVPTFNSESKRIAMGYANYAMVRVMVPFEFTKVKAAKEDGSVNEYTESHKIAAPKWERTYQCQEYYLHNGPMELDTNQVKLAADYEEEMISLNASVKPLSKRAAEETVELPLWRGINDPNTVKKVGSKYIITSNQADGTVWFSNGWTASGRQLAEKHSSYALVKVKVLCKINVNYDNGKREIDLDSIVPAGPSWKRYEHSASGIVSFIHNGALEVDVSSVQVEIKTKQASLSKRAKEHKEAGVFIPIPADLAKQFKSLGEHDHSHAHITVLFIGDVSKKQESKLVEIVEGVLSDQESFEVEFEDRVTYFPVSKHSEGCKVAKIGIKSKGLHKLHDALKKAIKAADITIEDHFPDYKPHTTLSYMKPPQEKYDGKTPTGSFTVKAAEIWGCGNKKKIPFGKDKKASFSPLSKRASVYGYWLDPNGQLYPVDYQHHDNFVRDHEELFGRDYKVTAYELAFSQDWIRITINEAPDRLDFEVPKFDNKYLARIQAILPKLPTSRMSMIDVPKGGFLYVKPWDLVSARSFGQLKEIQDKEKPFRSFAHAISKRAKADNILGLKHKLSPDKITRLYELEYKLFKLQSLGSGRPSTLKTIERLKAELSMMLPEMLQIMKAIYSEWIKFHGDVIEPQDTLKKVKIEYPEVDPSRLEDEYLDYQMGTITPHYNAFKKVEIQLQKELWSKPPLSHILETYKQLQRGATGNVGNDDALFNHALNVCHFGGPFLNYFADTTGISGQLLTDLSEGKYTDKWDVEISKFAVDALRPLSKRAK